MFAYSDPVGTGLLAQTGTLADYQGMVHRFYRQFARLRRSAFTLLDAFDGVAAARTDTVTWIAFPRTVVGSDRDIDTNRFTGGAADAGLQDEYVEWRVDRDPAGAIKTITFTTELPEYYEALAGAGLDALVTAISAVHPGAAPTTAELFGVGFNPATASKAARQSQFVAHLPNNPWQNGAKGILCLQQGNNTMFALFNLVGQCSIQLPGSSTSACTNAQSGACGEGRNSDPNICTAAQDLCRDSKVLALTDPVGIRIIELGGIWKLEGQQIDINNSQFWSITRNGRRGVLTAAPGLTLGDRTIETGTEVSRVLKVGASVVSAPANAVPSWARIGQESSRQIV